MTAAIQALEPELRAAIDEPAVKRTTVRPALTRLQDAWEADILAALPAAKRKDALADIKQQPYVTAAARKADLLNTDVEQQRAASKLTDLPLRHLPSAPAIGVIAGVAGAL